MGYGEYNSMHSIAYTALGDTLFCFTVNVPHSILTQIIARLLANEDR